jgi:hypothetical protein
MRNRPPPPNCSRGDCPACTRVLACQRSCGTPPGAACRGTGAPPEATTGNCLGGGVLAPMLPTTPGTVALPCEANCALPWLAR